jgi:pimeloyl-ACP methyl ester carboxylesterase
MCGCEKRGSAERFGKTYYLDGAGNWGFGASEVPGGLQQAGYHGDVELYVWTMSFNPLVDQLNIPGARLRASALARRIEDYHERYPDRKINVIALSAGTGVATWAIEDLKPSTKIHNLVLLGSSLSHDYDMRRALGKMTGKIYVYHSSDDEVLETVKIVGTIDGKRGVSSIGSVGLKAPRGMEGRVVNTPWNRSWVRLGWAGAHTDCTNQKFVRYEIAKHILDGSGVETPFQPQRQASVASAQ